MKKYNFYPLFCKIQQYAWGKFGTNSIAGKLWSSNQDKILDSNTPYAEFWVGDHPNGPSEVGLKSKKVTIPEFFSQDLSLLGPSILNFTNNEPRLPFLLKVLSINKSLSIQSHPDKKLAKRLHSQRPEIYKDPNHKPELAIALTYLEAFVGFRDPLEIYNNLMNYQPCKDLVGVELVNNLKKQISNKDGKAVAKTLKEIFKAISTAKADIVSTKADELIELIHNKSENEFTSDEKLILRLNKQFPGDVGIFLSFLMKYRHLKPNQAIFIGPNTAHNYLAGEIIECMATSDNVIRAGLTPKYKDVEQLIEMLDYDILGKPSNQIMDGVEIEKGIFQYKIPVQDFLVQIIHMGKNQTLQLPTSHSSSVFLLLNGTISNKDQDQQKYSSGTVWFIPQDSEINISSHEQTVLAVQAMLGKN
ncbi:mannose-6-phosphate isomerase [Anaeramoeba flamelloides]|uniref:mannose-6-phosphate isomerase n=1 Tax=Anaeramoeba flamelloides TaxID=1746091 RepID=A0AAV7YH99_9EUKA|nr:mannose-6-phosphate isomerase [Anaeramoeba flamelloides]